MKSAILMNFCGVTDEMAAQREVSGRLHWLGNKDRAIANSRIVNGLLP